MNDSPSILPQLREGLFQLGENLHRLKDRVRQAVAVEMSRVIADALRDLLTATLCVRDDEMPRYPSQQQYPPRSYSKEEDDSWDDDSPHSAHSQRPVTLSAAPASFWTAAVSVGVLAAKWLWTRRLPFWPWLSVGLLVGASTSKGRPAFRAALAALATAVDLVALTQPNPF